MHWLRFAKVGFVLCLAYGSLAALISVYSVPGGLFRRSLAVWLGIFALGTWRFVVLGYAARKQSRPADTRLDFVNDALLNLVGIVGVGPFGAILIIGSLNQPPSTQLKALVFGSLGVIGAVLCYVDLRRLLDEP